MKILNGEELAGFIKERQDHEVKMLRSNKIRAKLVIVRDSNNPVITKYVDLKRQYGEDIGIQVVDEYVLYRFVLNLVRFLPVRFFCFSHLDWLR